MSLSDPIADMLTRIRNGFRASKETVEVRASKLCEGLAGVLKEEGYINGYDRIDDGKQGILRIELKYDKLGRSAITDIKRTSKPGRRIHSGADGLPHVLDGLGIVVVSTSRGIMSDRKCREERIGGEILCMVS